MNSYWVDLQNNQLILPWEECIWPSPAVGPSFASWWKSHTTFVWTLACSICNESETSWTSQWVKYSMFGPHASQGTENLGCIKLCGKICARNAQD